MRYVPLELKLDVTQDCIYRGVNWAADCCPASIAFKRQHGLRVYVYYKSFRVFPNELGIVARSYPNPPALTEFVTRFDNGCWPEPRTFTLRVRKEWPTIEIALPPEEPAIILPDESLIVPVFAPVFGVLV